MKYNLFVPQGWCFYKITFAHSKKYLKMLPIILGVKKTLPLVEILLKDGCVGQVINSFSNHFAICDRLYLLAEFPPPVPVLVPMFQLVAPAYIVSS